MDLSETNYNVNNFNVPIDSEPSYCLCGRPYNADIFMMQCDSCKDWFHSTCCNFREWQAIEIDKYHCPRCSPIIGPSILKEVLNYHRHDYWDPEAAHKPVQTGTLAFIRELCSRHFPLADDIVMRANGHELTEDYFKAKGFNHPVVLNTRDGLDMIMPPDNFSYVDVLKLVGDEKEIDVIDVGRQSNVRMTLKDFVDYMQSSTRTRIFNIISLEFSNTGMTHIIEPPLIARKLDWVNSVWPSTYEGRPQVQKYCLMSAKDSYTDFHIDFGGTSVWYHILKGEKVFFFVRPTPANLTLYSQWMTSTNQSETFFGDQVDHCYKFHLYQGQTMLIPTGWIHAVYTPVDSLVFGGNFLHSYNIHMQLHCFEIEKKTKTEVKYLYPNFVTINFFAALKLLEEIVRINLSGEGRVSENLLGGLKALQQAVKQWNNEKDFNDMVREQLPGGVNIPKLLKDIGKEIRHAERIINHLNPPKPERESKRKRKKPVNKDFVDYSQSPKNPTLDYMPLPINEYNPPPTYSKSAADHKAPKANYPNGEPFSPLPSMSGNHLWNLQFDSRPQETVAEYKGGTVMKFKLGAKDMMSPGKDELNAYGEGFDNKDVYDFHDDSDRDEDCLNFTIDETQPITTNNNKKKGIKIKLPVKQAKKLTQNQSNGIESLLQASLSVPIKNEPDTEQSCMPVDSLKRKCSSSSSSTASIVDQAELSGSKMASPVTDQNGGKTSTVVETRKSENRYRAYRLDVNSAEPAYCIVDVPKNRSDHLSHTEPSTSQECKENERPSTKYSAQITVSDRSIESTRGRSHGGTSPSTSEAIAGMLSISQQNWPTKKEPQLEEVVKNVHQDEEYIYPSLDNSDDEDVHIFKPRGRTKIDEAWNPKARVGPLLPKMNRPAREGTKKPAVEKVLEAAAAARRTIESPTKTKASPTKRQYRRKKAKPTNVEVGQQSSAGSLLLPSTTRASVVAKVAAQPSSSSSSSGANPTPSNTSATSNKPKKGMKTVKQRLGKILKIHKMMH